MDTNTSPRSPLPLPPDFDSAVTMIVRQEDTGAYHASRLGAEFARKLVANGCPEDLAIAARVLESVLRCQETRPGDPHRGNFRWEMEDAGVEDLNAVHFVLIHLLPLLLRHGDRLPGDLRGRLHEAMHHAADEIVRIDVGLEYTNIVLKDVTNTLLAGELLERKDLAVRAAEKFEAWWRFTRAAGGVFELNSPAYTPISLSILHTLVEHTRDPRCQVIGRTVAARIALSFALRIMPETGRLAGPFSRAYWYQVLNTSGTAADFVRAAAGNGVVPDWIPSAIGSVVDAEVSEGSDRHQGLGATTWMGRSFAMGTATAELTSQANRYIEPVPSS